MPVEAFSTSAGNTVAFSKAYTPCGSTPITRARWSGGRRVRFSSIHAFISDTSGLSLVSSVISTAALGLTSVMSTPSRSPRKHLRAVLGDHSHHATMLTGPGQPHLRGPRPGPPRQAALCLRELPKKTTPPGILWYSSIPNLLTSGAGSEVRMRPEKGPRLVAAAGPEASRCPKRKAFRPR